MEAIIGGYNDDRAFAEFLGNWQRVLDQRIAQAASAVIEISGVEGLVLAGSNGAGASWPLSDIDLIPIYADASIDSAREAVERVSLSVMESWSGQGWRTGLDIGRPYFTVTEITGLSDPQLVDAAALLRDDRWYYAIDKAYRGRALLDHGGAVAQLAAWLTVQRFQPETVTIRLERSASETHRSLALARSCLQGADRLEALAAFLKAIQWRQVHLMESWGQRDNSLGRFGTRFAIEAKRHDLVEHAALLDSLASLGADQIEPRMSIAPCWVHERRNRSWAARQTIGETVTELQNDRDVLRVSTIYELRVAGGPPFAGWLSVPTEPEMGSRIARLASTIDERPISSEWQPFPR